MEFTGIAVLIRIAMTGSDPRAGGIVTMVTSGRTSGQKGDMMLGTGGAGIGMETVVITEGTVIGEVLQRNGITGRPA